MPRLTAENIDLFRWLNGLTVVPILHWCAVNGLATRWLPDDGRWWGLRELADGVDGRPTAPPLGSLAGALRTLALRGWLRLRGRDVDTMVQATAAGRAASVIALRHRATFGRAVEGLSGAVDYHRLFRETDGGDAPWVAEYAELVGLSERGWNLQRDTGDALADRVAGQLVEHLDGTVLGATIAALGMPAYRAADRAIVETSSGWLRRLVERSVAPTDLAAEFNVPAMGLALRLLAFHGLVEGAEDLAGVRLTSAGRSLAREAANVGVPVSYTRLYARLDETIFGTPPGADEDESRVVDRVMNLWGSAGSTVIGAFREQICGTVLRALFDELPLERQPLGIADMGAGSGEPLHLLAQYVIEATARGRSLDRYPFVVVGADRSGVARARMRETLRDLDAIPGVRTAILHGDVSDPEEYDARIRGLALSRRDPSTGSDRPVDAGDFLHTQMFLLHDRELAVTTAQLAERLLGDAVTEVNRWALEDALHGLVPAWSHAEARDEARVAALAAAQFTTCHAAAGTLVPAAVSAADLVALVRRWRPHLRYGLVLLEAHVPRLEDADAAEVVAVDAGVDPGPAIWGVHFASGQFLMPYREHELAMTLAGLAPALSTATATGSVSLGWWVPADDVYLDPVAATGSPVDAVAVIHEWADTA